MSRPPENSFGIPLPPYPARRWMRWQHPRVELLIDPKHTETMERLYPPFHNYHGPSRYCYCFRSQQRGSLYGYRYILYLYICCLTISYFVYHFFCLIWTLILSFRLSFLIVWRYGHFYFWSAVPSSSLSSLASLTFM